MNLDVYSILFIFLSLKIFKANILQVTGDCPKCHKNFNRLRTHANSCFRLISDFNPFISVRKISTADSFGSNYDTQFLSELPFFTFDGILTENDKYRGF